MSVTARIALAAGTAALLLWAVPGHAETIEELVAKVNDDIITRSELQDFEQAAQAEAYRSLTGKDLDERVKGLHANILRDLIEQKILYHRAQRLYDMDKMGEAFLSSFKEQQRIKSDEDLKRVLEQEGMTVADLKRRLIELWAPHEVLRYEVSDRVSVGDKEVEAYYAEHVAEFEVPAEATVREIVLLADDANREARREAAEAARQQAAAPGADFARVAAEVSEAGTRTNGGLLATVRKGDLSPRLEEAVFSAPVGEVGPVLEFPYGFHVIKVEARTEARTKALDEVREEIRDRLHERKYKATFDAFIARAWSEAEVWVSPKYRDRLSPGPGAP